MRFQDIKIGETYRLRAHPNYGYIKAIEKLRPGQGANILKYCVIKCEHTVDKNGSFGFVRYFRPIDILPLGGV
jgi:hypothetical protein